MTYTLKHFDTPLIKFALDNEKLKGVVCEVLWTDETAKGLFPWQFLLTPEASEFVF